MPHACCCANGRREECLGARDRAQSFQLLRLRSSSVESSQECYIYAQFPSCSLSLTTLMHWTPTAPLLPHTACIGAVFCPLKPFSRDALLVPPSLSVCAPGPAPRASCAQRRCKSLPNFHRPGLALVVPRDAGQATASFVGTNPLDQGFGTADHSRDFSI